MSAGSSERAGAAAVPAYEVRRLSFRYGDRRRPGSGGSPDWVLNGLDFSIRQGEIFGVIGPNGSGKSSLLKALAGLVEPQEGAIRLFGAPFDATPRDTIARQVAYMPQDLSCDFPFSVLDTVLMGRFPYRQRGMWSVLGWERETDRAVVERAMAQAGVTQLATCEVGRLSAGERQRVLLARALAQEPRVLLLDEPTAHLDLQHQLDVGRILKLVHGTLGMTVVLVSHDINLASQYCDRILLMKGGRRLCLGSPTTVIIRSNLQEVYGCEVLIDAHPETGLPRVSLPRQDRVQAGALSQF